MDTLLKTSEDTLLKTIKNDASSYRLELNLGTTLTQSQYLDYLQSKLFKLIKHVLIASKLKEYVNILEVNC